MKILLCMIRLYDKVLSPNYFTKRYYTQHSKYINLQYCSIYINALYNIYMSAIILYNTLNTYNTTHQY